ncbi:MAG: ribulose-phosphate 3-epimerase [Bacteroidetes bacterium GWE2_41_25]|nr:MAG: ribulose-phosphate 3-epimerase [Bacteroidetes bacterium GWA2_40_15]OFX86069.1 MAG: ribulose-phosphate 3-epimerase [Bacteroidetes bacterium GWC2_40_22]OFX91044.1 MAG: ribulose-phosphate 3-epimerase [Bacteroidetes bacterium GWE2_41_25]OFY61687.1 MAG: ribulose-phosphate 3-epimerase [Bacteroidetes bacterium GWF2_41_9]HAM09017.1 ribulose-phosphate 3-epimerase [Bacteroidales bacterium]
MGHLVSPSLLAADFGNLGKDIKMVNESKADWLHLDIMDGVFVPNISFGFPVLEFVRKLSEKPLDVHLMIVDPDRYLSRFSEAGAGILTVQYEACTHLHRTVTEIRNLGMKAGVAVNPHTPVSLLKNTLPYIDMVLIMTVNPGFGGQKFIMESYNKITELREIIERGGYNVLIEVDGGIDTGNAAKLVKSGVNVLVAGNSVFSSADPINTILNLKDLTGN